MIKTHHLRFGDRTYSAVFNLNVLDKLGEMAGAGEDGKPLDANTLLAVWSTPYGLFKALVEMIREGERIEGRSCDLTEQWLRDNLNPAEGMWLQRRIAAMMVDGMRMETAISDEEEVEVDEVLEEIKKKVTKAE